MAVPSFTMVCETGSLFVHVTVVPLGTVTEAGLKAKFMMVTAAGGRGAGVVVAAVVVVAGMVVTRGVAVVVTKVVTSGEGGMDVVAGVAWVVTGPGLYCGPVQPAIRTASRITAPVMAYQVRGVGFAIENPHVSDLLKEYKSDLYPCPSG
jgi:hypothetical protein